MGIFAFAWRNWVRSQGSHSGRLFCGPTLGHRTFRIQSKNADPYTAVLGLN